MKLWSGNRKKFAKKMENSSVLVIFAGNPPVKRGDEFYLFEQQKNLLYLTGIHEPNIALVMAKNRMGTVSETLYLQRYDEIGAKWDGAVLDVEKAREISGIERYKFMDELEKDLSMYFVRGGINVLYVDMENRGFDIPLSPDLELVKRVGVHYPAVKAENAYPIFAELRVLKEKEEVKFMKEAIDVTNEGLKLMMKNAKPGMMEYEIEAYFDFTLKKKGVMDRAFKTIAAAGKNATILHYIDNNSKTGKEDLILFDLGAKVNGYSADITRTFPVSGKFTERQKEIYNIVLGGQQKVIDAIKPGVAFSELNEVLINFYTKELKKIGLIEKKEELFKYYYHGVSHMLGLETHDIGRGGESDLKKGMVLTVEPGLYIEEENIGIRIEDDVLVTDKGCEVLSKDIIKTVEDIEAFMKK